MKKKSLEEQAAEILEQAEAKGLMNNFFFATTFKRYTVQMNMLDSLWRKVQEDGYTTEKEYVKGRVNIVANPALTEYNKTSTAANGTVKTLLEIVKTLGNETTGGSLADRMKELTADG